MKLEKAMELSADIQFEDNILYTDIDTTIGTGTNDYKKLINKPSINGTELYDNYNEIDPTVPDWAKEPDKPQYDPSEIGAIDENNVVTESEIDLMFLKIFGK